MKRGQVQVAVPIVVALLTMVGGYITAKATANDQIAERMGNIKTDVAVLQNSDANQDQAIKEMKDDIKYIRDRIDRVLQNK